MKNEYLKLELSSASRTVKEEYKIIQELKNKFRFSLMDAIYND